MRYKTKNRMVKDCVKHTTKSSMTTTNRNKNIKTSSK